MSEKKMEKIVSLCKRRGFVYAGSDLYGGLANTYDYGPLGVELKNNLRTIWWKKFVRENKNVVGLDGGIFMSPKVWEASGHLKNFKDPLKECKECHARFRPDKVDDPNVCPICGKKNLTEEKLFLGMFRTFIGPVEEEALTAYLRPETAQAIFVNYKNVLDSTNQKIPFGIAQTGKAFRNEITTGNFIFRTLEFEQMELEYFISPDSDWQKDFDFWQKNMRDYADEIGINMKKLHAVDIPKDERAHYSQKTIDFEYEFPFGQDELWGLAYRTDYDLKKHQESSGEDLQYFDPQAQEKYLPHVIEPSLGLDRSVLAVLCSAYREEEVSKDEIRVVLQLKPEVAPYKIAVFPLLKNKEKLVKKAKEIYQDLNKQYMVFWDDRGNIGKRYRYQDEIGTPYCVTVDFETVEKDQAVTVRDRDTMEQERVKIKDLEKYFDEKLAQ
ncbi:MAG TPA: glycine--tRNA ligase [Patescibacteria group bacterium]|nr:glycine--tRNA ligase [Patescibacteria group bacterium]